MWEEKELDKYAMPPQHGVVEMSDYPSSNQGMFIFLNTLL